MFLALGPMHIFSPYIDTYISSFFKTHTQSYTTLIILKKPVLPKLCLPWSPKKGIFLNKECFHPYYFIMFLLEFPQFNLRSSLCTRVTS